MISETIGFLKEIYTFYKANPEAGIKIIGVIAGIIIIRKLIKSKKVQDWIKKTGFGLGVAVSKLLLAQCKKGIAEWVERLLMDIRICFVLFLDSFIKGLRSDNKKREEAINKKAVKKQIKAEAKKASKKMKAETKAIKMANKIKGKSNL